MPSDAVQEAIRRSEQRVAWLLDAIPRSPGSEGGAGADLSRDRGLAELVARFNSIAPYAVDPQRWHALAGQAAELVQRRSKDIGVAAYLTVAWVHNHSVTGLLDGLVLLRELAQRYWYWLYPPVAKPRSRAFVVEWLAQHTASVLYRAETRTTLVEVQAVQAVLEQIDGLACDKLGEHYRGADALWRALDVLRLRFEDPQAFAEADQQRQAIVDSFGGPVPRIIGPPPPAPPVAAHPVQRWQRVDVPPDLGDPHSRLRDLHGQLAELHRFAGVRLRPEPAQLHEIEREIVALSHQLGILPGASSYLDAAPITPPPPAVRRARAAVLGHQAAPRSMRGAPARDEPLPPEGPPVSVLHLAVRVGLVPTHELRSHRSMRAGELSKGVPYRLEIALEPARDATSLANAQLHTAEFCSEFGLPRLHVGLEATGALLAFPDHPGSVGPRLISDPLPCSLSNGTKTFEFDIMVTCEPSAELDVTVWLGQEVLLRARVVLPVAP